MNHQEMLWKKCSVLLQCWDSSELSKEFILETDASLTDLGTRFTQQGKDRNVSIILYVSWSLCPSERSICNFSSAKLELLALKWAITKKFCNYLLYLQLQVYTDNNPLTYIQESKLGTSQLWWLTELPLFYLTSNIEWIFQQDSRCTKLPSIQSCCRPQERKRQWWGRSYILLICLWGLQSVPQQFKNTRWLQKWGTGHQLYDMCQCFKCCLHFWTILTPRKMAEEQQKDPMLELVCQYVTAGEKLKTLAIIELNQRL